MKFANDLLQLSRPQFGQTIVWLLLVFCLVLAALPPNYVDGERIRPATVISFLPDTLLASTTFYHVMRIVLCVAAILWAFRVLIPWSCWATTLGFTIIWALRMENSFGAAHIFNVTNMLLVIHAMWFHFYRREICDSLVARSLWQSAVYPRWAFLLSVFYIGFYHSLAGVSKLRYSGLDWGDGLSLQLWVHLWGWEYSPFGSMILSSRKVATVVQSSALFFETAAVLAVTFPKLRVFIGLGLLGFYAGVLGTFVDFGFHFNAILVAVFLLPVEPMLRRRYPVA